MYIYMWKSRAATYKFFIFLLFLRDNFLFGYVNITNISFEDKNVLRFVFLFYIVVLCLLLFVYFLFCVQIIHL